MTIIEFVHLSLPSPYHSSHEKLLSIIPKCCAIMGHASGLPSIFFADLMDERKMYVVGGWPSKAAHQGTGPGKEKTGGFSGSEEQGKLIAEIGGLMEIEWMEYVGLSMSKDGVVGGGGGGVGGEGLDVGKPGCVVAVVIDCGDLDADSGGEGARVKLEDAVKRKLNLGDGGEEVVVGWNLKKEEQESETDYLIVFKGFEGPEEGRAWGKTIREKIEGEGLEGVRGAKVVYMRRAGY